MAKSAELPENNYKMSKKLQAVFPYFVERYWILIALVPAFGVTSLAITVLFPKAVLIPQILMAFSVLMAVLIHVLPQLVERQFKVHAQMP